MKEYKFKILYEKFSNNAYVQKKLHAYQMYEQGIEIAKIQRILGMSRATVYRWIKQVKEIIQTDVFSRYKELLYHYKRRKYKLGRPRKIKPDIVEKILAVRNQTKAGKYKLEILLYKRFGIKVSASTIGRVLRMYRSKIEKPRGKYFVKRDPKKDKKLRITDINLHGKPLELIQIDTKHYVEIGQKKAYIFVAIDIRSRLAFAMFYKEIKSKNAADFLTRVNKYFGSFGKLKYIQTDNGSEYAGEFEKQIRELGLIHVYSHVRKPKENGYVERLIRSLEEEFLSELPRGLSINEYNAYLLEWLTYYNTERPHAGLRYKTPIEVIEGSGNHTPNIKLSQLFWTYTSHC